MFDNLKGRLYLIVHADPRVEGAFEQAQARLDALTAKLRAPGAGYPAPLNSDVLDESDFVSGFTAKASSMRSSAARNTSAPVTSSRWCSASA